MYFQLAQSYFFFERILESANNYFNIEDYQVYSAEERQELINADTFRTNAFLLIPQLERNEIAIKYLTEKNNQKLLRKREHKDFYQRFHWYTEDNYLVDDWNSFEKSELITFASMWCEQNQIEFTTGG